MNKIAMAIHGGAGAETEFLKKHIREQEKSLEVALLLGYEILKKGGSSLDAVEAAVSNLEDNELFNAGRGSVLNNRGEVEMDAAIMDGEKLKAGAVSMVRQIKNPISLARTIMTETKHVFLSGYGALEFAKNYHHLVLENPEYFITKHQYEEFLLEKQLSEKTTYGTVGAVALDKKGNLAAATSTGGTSHCLPGRVGDSCIIGAGCYANNNTCAVSATGHGEFIITGVIAHTISMLIELKGLPLQEACDYVIHPNNNLSKAEMGVISVNREGMVGISFNCKTMNRGWIGADEDMQIKIY